MSQSVKEYLEEALTELMKYVTDELSNDYDSTSVKEEIRDGLLKINNAVASLVPPPPDPPPPPPP